MLCARILDLRRNLRSRQHSIKAIDPLISISALFRIVRWPLGVGHAGNWNTCGPQRLGFPLKYMTFD